MHRESGANLEQNKDWVAPQTGGNKSLDSLSSSPHTNAGLKGGIESRLNDMRERLRAGDVRTPKSMEAKTGSLETDTQRVLENSQLEYLGAGAENIVFAVDQFPEEVAKVHAKTLGELIEINTSRGLEPDDTSPEQWEKLKRYAREARARHKQLQAYFGDSVLDEKVLRRQIPVTRELLEASLSQEQRESSPRKNALEKLEPGKVYKLWTAVRLQERLPEASLDPDDSFSFNTNYVERRKQLDDEEYESLNADLVDGIGTRAERYLAHYPELQKILDRMKTEPGMAEAIQDFVEKAMRYTMETGEIIDVAGKSNIRLYKDEGKWKMVLADPMLADKIVWAKATLAMGGVESGQPLQERSLIPVLNALNYARLINAMASVTGLEGRLRFPNDVSEASVKFLHKLSEHPKFSGSSGKRRQYRSEPTQAMEVTDTAETVGTIPEVEENATQIF